VGSRGSSSGQENFGITQFERKESLPWCAEENKKPEGPVTAQGGAGKKAKEPE